jgi:ABC-type phosphate/phosphonate transport system permease subunit
VIRGRPALKPGVLGRSHHLTRIRRQDGKGTTIMLKTLQISTAATLVAVNEALAQTTPAAPAAPGATDESASWLWLIVLLAIVAAAAWYFLRRRSRTTTTSTTGTSTTSGTAGNRPNVYDKDRRP